MAFKLIPSQLYGWISEKFLRKSLLQTLIHWLKRCSSKWPAVCTYVQNSFWVLKLPLAALGCYDTDARLFTYPNNKPFFYMSSKHWIMMDYRKTKKSWMKTNVSIGWNQFLDIHWLISVCSLISTCLTRWFDFLNHNP